MCYSLPEALWLHAAGTSDDLLVAYPTVDRRALRALAADGEARRRITIMTDSPAHLDVVDRALGDGHPQIRVCLDLDVSWRPLGRRPAVHIGTRRSPLHTPEQAAGFARTIARRAGFRLAGVMGYEGQIAGLGDAPPGPPAQGSADQADPGPFGSGTGPPAGRDDPPHPGPDHPGLCQRRRDRQPGVDRAGRVGDRAHGGFRAGRPDPVRRLPPVRPRARRCCSRCRWCEGRARVSPRCSPAATSPPAPAPRTGCRARTCPRACPSPASRAPARSRRRCAARPPSSCRPATGSGCVTPRPANSPSASRVPRHPRRRAGHERADVPGRGSVLRLGNYPAR